MTTRQRSSLSIVFILGLLAMLMPLSIDMYLPALPVIASQFGVEAGSAQMTLSMYILGFAIGQLFYGPMADSLGRKPVLLGGILVFALAAAACHRTGRSTNGGQYTPVNAGGRLFAAR